MVRLGLGFRVVATRKCRAPLPSISFVEWKRQLGKVPQNPKPLNPKPYRLYPNP